MLETVHVHGFYCPIVNILNIIGGKWKVLILYYLNSETRRFNELQCLLAGIIQRMPTLQLRELENNDIVHQEVYPQIPPRIEYSLTEFGWTLMPAAEAMHHWGK